MFDILWSVHTHLEDVISDVEAEFESKQEEAFPLFKNALEHVDKLIDVADIESEKNIFDDFYGVRTALRPVLEVCQSLYDEF